MTATALHALVEDLDALKTLRQRTPEGPRIPIFERGIYAAFDTEYVAIVAHLCDLHALAGQIDTIYEVTA